MLIDHNGPLCNVVETQCLGMFLKEIPVGSPVH